MRKVILFSCIALLCVSCGELSRNDWSCYVKNSTEQTLTLRYPYFTSSQRDSKYRECEIQPGYEIEIYGCFTSAKKTLEIGYYFEKSAEIFGEDVNWQILSEDGHLLKTWSYSDISMPDQRFFEESSWRYFSTTGEWMTETFNRWVFPILPEDIAE